MNFKKLPILFVLLSISGSVIAAVPLTSDSVVGMITNSMASAANILLTQALIWLAAFASIQFFITNFGLLKSGADIEAIFAKLIGSLLWLGFCIYVLTNGPGYIGAVGKQFFNLFGISLPSPGGIIAGTILTVGGLAAGAVTAGIISNTAGTLWGRLRKRIAKYVKRAWRLESSGTVLALTPPGFWPRREVAHRWPATSWLT